MSVAEIAKERRAGGLVNSREIISYNGHRMGGTPDLLTRKLGDSFFSKGSCCDYGVIRDKDLWDLFLAYCLWQ